MLAIYNPLIITNLRDFLYNLNDYKFILSAAIVVYYEKNETLITLFRASKTIINNNLINFLLTIDIL